MSAMSPDDLFRREATTIRPDEEVLLFPTFGHRDATGGWAVPVRGWVFEPERDGLLRARAFALLRRFLGVGEELPETDTFRRRAWPFLVDNERGKTLAVRLGGRVYPLGESGADGHFTGLLRPSAAEVESLAPGGEGWIDFEAVTEEGDPRRFPGRARLTGETGLTVVSDIDDTVKVSEVHDRRALLANTFVRDFRPVSGMAELYQSWAARGAAFHYVSASPWQLYQPLAEFVHDSGLPAGSFHLRSFRWKDASLVEFLTDREAKRRVIVPLLEAFPRRKFVLVGDSGEKDPEIYASLWKERPEQVARILIRDVIPGGMDPGRFGDAPPGVWRIFHDPTESGVEDL
jgi:hypothetical protein